MITVFGENDANEDGVIALDEFEHLFCEVYGYCGCAHNDDEMCPE